MAAASAISSGEDAPTRKAVFSLMGHRKPLLPVRTCATCGRDFAWRKRWRKDWEQVKYCSQHCRRKRKGAL